MIEFSNLAFFIFLINSIFLIGLILNQNDSTRDSIITKNSSNLKNPLENITWISVFLQFSLMLIKIKIS